MYPIDVGGIGLTANSHEIKGILALKSDAFNDHGLKALFFSGIRRDVLEETHLRFSIRTVRSIVL